ILLALELTSVLDVRPRLELGADRLSDGDADLVDDGREVTTADVALDDDSSDDVLAVDRVRAARLDDLGDFAEGHARARGCVDPRRTNRLDIVPRLLV